MDFEPSPPSLVSQRISEKIPKFLGGRNGNASCCVTDLGDRLQEKIGCNQCLERETVHLTRER